MKQKIDRVICFDYSTSKPTCWFCDVRKYLENGIVSVSCELTKDLVLQYITHYLHYSKLKWFNYRVLSKRELVTMWLNYLANDLHIDITHEYRIVVTFLDCIPQQLTIHNKKYHHIYNCQILPF